MKLIKIQNIKIFYVVCKSKLINDIYDFQIKRKKTHDSEKKNYIDVW